jgi:DNA-binding response OmpR family regulator
LLRHGRVVSKAQLQDHLTHFGGDLGDTAIEVYVHRVRKKLENCRVEIVTVRGFGYLLQEIRPAA